jgi:hypothetical protein
MTGAGGESIREAFKAGERGGAYGKSFRDNMRGRVTQESVLDDAKGALEKMRSDRSAEYNKGMAATKANKLPADYQPIETAMNDVVDTLFHGPVTTTDKASISLAKKVGKKLNEWQAAYPNPTVYDLDRLKIAIDKLKPNWTQESGDQSRIIAAVRSAVKDEILRKDPGYAKTMAAYEDSIGTQQEIQQRHGIAQDAIRHA